MCVVYLKDNENMKFETRDQLTDYIDHRAKTDQWYETTMNTAKVIAGSGTSEEFKEEYGSRADLKCIKDCMSGDAGTNLFLEMYTDINGSTKRGVLPLRYTALPSLYNRANIGGQSMTRDEEKNGVSLLSSEERARILNICLPHYQTKAKVLYRDGKISSVMSGQYAIISEKEIVASLEAELADRYPNAEFKSGHASHEYFHLEYLLHDDEIEEDIEIALNDSGESVGKVEAVLAVHTSDVGEKPVVCYTYLNVDDMHIAFGKPICAKHIGKKTIDDVTANLKKVYKLFNQSKEDLARLSKIRIKNPAGCLRSIAKEYKLPKKIAMGVALELELKMECSAYEIYWSLNRIAEIYGENCNDIWKTLDIQETVAETLHADFTKFDKPFEWARGEDGGLAA